MSLEYPICLSNRIECIHHWYTHHTLADSNGSDGHIYYKYVLLLARKPPNIKGQLPLPFYLLVFSTRDFVVFFFSVWPHYTQIPFLCSSLILFSRSTWSVAWDRYFVTGSIQRFFHHALSLVIFKLPMDRLNSSRIEIVQQRPVVRLTIFAGVD